MEYSNAKYRPTIILDIVDIINDASYCVWRVVMFANQKNE